MKAPADVDPEMLVVLEIVQHCAEILSRLPLHVLRGHLGPGEDNLWVAKAYAAVLAAESFEMTGAQLRAEEGRTEGAPARPAPTLWPDDSLPSDVTR